MGIVLPELGHQCAIQPLDKAVAQANCILPLCSKRMHSIHHSLIILNDTGVDRLTVGTRQCLTDVIKNCMWLVAVAWAELDKDGHCDLPEAEM
jgi:hypothetical protein